MKHYLYMFLLIICFTPQGFSQQKHGVIIYDNENKAPLQGASLIESGTENVLITDDTGYCELPTNHNAIDFVVSHVGYQSFQFTWTGQDILQIGLNPDYQILETLVVKGYDNERSLMNIPGAYSVLPGSEIGRFMDASLVRSVNTLPGVRFEERSPGSYRVSLRGNLLRSPYGVRNVKVYWNDIPYTDPTGTTPLNLLDNNNIDKVEIIRGPAGSVYGAGLGGVLQLKSVQKGLKQLSGEIGTIFGSFGFRKITGNLNLSGPNHQIFLRYSSQFADGYRDHSKSERETVQLQGQVYASEKQTISLNIMYSDLFYQTPGGLTKAQYDEDPRQARQISKAQNASIDQQYFLAGIAQDYRFNDRFGNVTAIYLANGTKENPFITNWELERLKGYGGRTKFYYDLSIGNIPSHLSVGGELQYGDFNADNHGNSGGSPDTLRYEDALKSLNAFGFGQLELNLPKNWMATVGASVNYLKYDIHRLQDVALDTSYQLTKTFTPVFSPRIGLVKKFSRQFAVHGSISYGFSPPTTEEVRTSDGSINGDLEAEKGVNFEIGFRGNAIRDRLMVDLSVFRMPQDGTIVSRTTEDGTVIFENSGSISQTGVELLLGYTIINNPQSRVSMLRIQTAYTWHYFKFKDYNTGSGDDTEDYSGNALTGTAPNISVTTIDFQMKPGLYSNFTFNFTDRIPLNNANDVYADSYKLMTWKIGWQKDIGKIIGLNLFVGVDNLLNEKYSLGNDLNAFGKRYYNPSPERNFFAGLKITFNED